MKLYTLTFHLDGGELCTVRGAGRVPEPGERPLIEDPITGTVGRYVVAGIRPTYVASNAHTEVSARIGGGILTVVEGTVHVDLERAVEQPRAAAA